ncbi:MAG: YidC/Oxa1 family membrane protein insertase [Thermoleophilaceae bacterium]
MTSKGHESFGFIPDLAQPLTGHPFVLALMIVLYVGTQLIASLITTVGGDKTQQRIMLALPFVFTIFIINFQAGLILYWVTTNFWTIGQQLVVRKLYPKPEVLKDVEKDLAGSPSRGKPPGGCRRGGGLGERRGGRRRPRQSRRARRRSDPGAAGSGLPT